MSRDVAAMTEVVVQATAGARTPDEGLERAIAAALRQAREHPLLDRIIRAEPELLLPLLTTDRPDGDGGDGAIVSLVRAAAEQVIRTGLDLDELTTRQLADVLARLLISYSINAPDEPPEVIAEVVTRLLLRGALPPSTSSTASAGGNQEEI